MWCITWYYDNNVRLIYCYDLHWTTTYSFTKYSREKGALWLQPLLFLINWAVIFTLFTCNFKNKFHDVYFMLIRCPDRMLKSAQKTVTWISVYIDFWYFIFVAFYPEFVITPTSSNMHDAYDMTKLKTMQFLILINHHILVKSVSPL